MFEYVEKKVYRPLRIECEKAIRKAQKELRKKGITFQFKPIGSLLRKLITREINGNKGFDFDYNFVLQSCPSEYYEDPKKLKLEIMQCVCKYFGSEYKAPQDSTSVFTIKKVDKEKSKILHSFDFAIIKDVVIDGKVCRKYIRFFKDKIPFNSYYSWERRGNGLNYQDMEKQIKGNLWNEVRILYLTNKNKELKKKSRIVYYETIKTIYDKHFPQTKH